MERRLKRTLIYPIMLRSEDSCSEVFEVEPHRRKRSVGKRLVNHIKPCFLLHQTFISIHAHHNDRFVLSCLSQIANRDFLVSRIWCLYC